MADPRVGLLGVAAGVGLVTAFFLALVGGHVLVLPVPLGVLSLMLLLNLRQRLVRTVLAVLVAVFEGLLSLPLLLNGTGVIPLIGCLAGVAALFYHEPAAGTPTPGWLETRRVRHRRGRTPSASHSEGGSQAAEPVHPPRG